VRDLVTGYDVTLEDRGLYLLKGSTATGGCWRSHGPAYDGAVGDSREAVPAVGALLRPGLSRIWCGSRRTNAFFAVHKLTSSTVAIPSRRMVAVMNDRASSAVVDADLLLADGRRLGYAVWGEPEGQPALLFHGSPGSRLFCPDPVATAAAGVRLVTVDRPGYGRSAAAPGRRILDWPADIEQLVTALGIDRFALMGHSSGGPYALACALAMPQRITRMALVSCVVPLDEVPAAWAALDEDERRLVELARDHPDQAAATIADAAGWLADQPDRFLTLPRPEPDALLLQDPSVRSRYLDMVREAVRQGLAGYVSDEVLERRPWGFRLGDVNSPVAVWHGGKDGYIPLAHVEAMAALLPRSRTRFHADQAHGLIISSWVAILAELTS
jgi:pimeloyl-ACP methyl ester carboxylesterase